MVRSEAIATWVGLVTAASVFTAAAFAHDAIVVRRKIMKAIGSATKEAQEMARGQRAFDAQKAATQMRLISASWTDLSRMFPEGSDAGGRTRAAAAIWISFADFDAQGRDMAAHAAKAEAAAAQGLEAFKAAFEPVAATCKDCHRTYMTRD